jgi:hypothetical protein
VWAEGSLQRQGHAKSSRNDNNREHRTQLLRAMTARLGVHRERLQGERRRLTSTGASDQVTMYPDPLERERSRVAAVHERARTGQPGHSCDGYARVECLQGLQASSGCDSQNPSESVGESVQELQSRWVSGLILRTTKGTPPNQAGQGPAWLLQCSQVRSGGRGKCATKE